MDAGTFVWTEDEAALLLDTEKGEQRKPNFNTSCCLLLFICLYKLRKKKTLTAASGRVHSDFTPPKTLHSETQIQKPSISKETSTVGV